jgi:catechol 2,3-dioxygenase-like lactoylglutathione lyase family enzyme
VEVVSEHHIDMTQPHTALSRPAPRIDVIHHLTLPVNDLARAEAFYVGLLGATLLRRFGREELFAHRPERIEEADADQSPYHLEVRFHDTPEIHLFLQRGRLAPTPPPHPHLAFAVDHDELDAFTARLREAGVPVDGPRRLGPPGQASVYFADPFGNTLELTTMGYRGEVEIGPPDVKRLAHAT